MVPLWQTASSITFRLAGQTWLPLELECRGLALNVRVPEDGGKRYLIPMPMCVFLVVAWMTIKLYIYICTSSLTALEVKPPPFAVSRLIMVMLAFNMTG